MAKPTILVMCHDTSGGQLLMAAIASHKNDADWQIYATGPSEHIAMQQQLGTFLIDDYKTSEPDAVFTATGWQTDVEHTARLYAESINKPCYTFLHNYQSYKEQLTYDGNLITGDYLVTYDRHMQEEYDREQLPLQKLTYCRNYYWQQLHDEPTQLPRRDYLFISEPLKEKCQHQNEDYLDKYGFSEVALVEDLVNEAEFLGSTVTIRLHPAEQLDKYQNILAKPNVQFVNSDQPLTKDIDAHRIIIGMESTDLIVAAMRGKPTISWLPNGDWQLPLPGVAKQMDLDLSIPWSRITQPQEWPPGGPSLLKIIQKIATNNAN